MEVNAAHRACQSQRDQLSYITTVVFVVLVERGAHAVVIELDDTGVETHNDPGALGVEGNT